MPGPRAEKIKEGKKRGVRDNSGKCNLKAIKPVVLKTWFRLASYDPLSPSHDPAPMMCDVVCLVMCTC